MAAERKAKTAQPETKAVLESVYTVDQLIDGYKVFGTSKPIVTVALKLDGKKEYTLERAKTIIEKFKNKEVK